ncbi:MAG TPA: response regulator transcription factor [Chitinophaga sp.]
MDTIRVALVDDHQLFREGLAELIRGFQHYEVMMEAENGQDFIARLQGRSAPDIVLLDINMKGMDGYDTAAWLREHCPETRVLALSMYENEQAVIRMLRLGVKGYVLKDIKKQELQQALTSLVQKGYYYTELVTGKLIHAINHLDDLQPSTSLGALAALNPRELEFLKLVCSELTYKDIAARMNVSVHTVDGYRDALFEKLQVKSRVGLVLYAIRNKIFLVE